MLRLALAALLTALLLAAAPAHAAPPRGDTVASVKNACTRGACAIRRARRMLADRMFTRFVDTGSEIVQSSFDQRLHLCRSRRFVYDTVSNLPEVGTSVQRVEGTWRVTSARFGPGRRARARVRGTPSDGSPPVTVTITREGSIVRVDGLAVFVAPSDLC